MAEVEISYLEALQLIAFDLVAKSRRKEPTGDEGYLYRKIYRWYSKEFMTPLDRVYELPIHDILVAYWESHFEAMEDEELEQERLELIKTESQRERDKLIKDYEDVEFFNDNELAGNESKADEMIDKAISEVDKFNNQLNKLKEGWGKETSLNNAPINTNLPPNVSIRFPTDDEFNAKLEEDSLGIFDNPKKQK